jgi:hypothetical protein
MVQMPATNYENKIHLLLSDSRGQYIPRDFAANFDLDDWHVKKGDIEAIEAGPEHEWYWEAWNSVLDSAYYMVESYSPSHDVPNLIGKWTLCQDGDLWAIHESMTDEDWKEWSPF